MVLRRALHIFLKLSVARIDKDLELPTYQHPHDAAFDLRAREKVVIEPGAKQVVKTGLKLAIPSGHVGLIWDRSGLAAKHHITTLAGVIDAGYRGEVGVVLHNLGTEPFLVEHGMRIAQMIIQPYVTPEIIELENLDESTRGDGGFGSTGLH